VRRPRSHPHLQRLYRRYNRKYFGGRLPTIYIQFLAPGQFKKNGLGRATCAVTCFEDGSPVAIYISANRLKTWRYIKADLLHEMCHVAHPKAQHGPAFENEMKRLAAAGAFKGVW
jgi:SprT-like family